MTKYYISVLLARFVLPGALLLSMSLRPFGVSILYLLLYLWLPLVQLPDSKTFSGLRGMVLLMNVLVSFTLLILHIAWHSYLAAMPPYGSAVTACSDLQSIAQNLGFVIYDNADPLMLAQLLAPELVMTLTSLVVYLVMKKLLKGPPTEAENHRDYKHQQYPFLTNAGKYISLFLIMFSGILRPSVTSGIYFLTFIGAATAWSLGKELARAYAVVGRCLMGIMAAHVAVLFAYQCSYVAPFLPNDDVYTRIFGFTQLVKIDCKTPNDVSFVDVEWATFASPLVILFTYYVLALETRELFKPKAKKKMSTFSKLEAGKLNGSLVRGMSFRRLGSKKSTQDRWRTATKKVRLIRGISPSKKLSMKRSTPNIRGLHQDSTGSVIVPDEESMEDTEPPGLLDDIVLAIIGFFQVLIRSSYIATSITMMAWSIMYHSWLTFVFLMWANVVWLRQNQRSFMLSTSPVLVCYALFLLLSQYIYGMDLNDEELPSSVEGVNLGQIGFTRPSAEPCVPLLIKSIFTCMFWITLRQRIQEAQQRKQSSTIADMVAPLQLTVSTAASVIEKQPEEYQQSRLLVKIGELLKSFCTRFWIYVVVIMLFIIGITGERMTIFRILYMFLFLSFILLFQISWRLWRRLMYAFWIVLIVYSMINLVLVYIYQFDNFPQTIEQYLAVPVKLQYDLGLEKYKTADLFVRLLTPTCFLIITIMQVHYFHKDFLEMSKLKSRSSSMRVSESGRPSQSGVSTIKDDLPGLSSEEEVPKHRASLGPERPDDSTEQSIEMSSFNRRSTRRSIYRRLSRAGSKSYAPTLTEHTSVGFRDMLAAFAGTARRVYRSCRDLVFLYLEIHLIKIIFLALMLLSVLNVCALHVPIMLVISPCLLLNTRRQKLCSLLISVLISVYLMAKMIYQIEYIPHNLFDVNCTFQTSGVFGNETSENTTTYNNAEWIGFVKASKEKPLTKILKGYISCIAIFTFHSMVMYRQQRFRSFGLSGPNKDKVMFPDITRKEADVDFMHCLKYLVNYGFYKFGVEVTLICLIGVIGSRMDLYAVLYACWLLALVCVSRRLQACLWPAFTGFVMVLVPLQYMIAVGFLPQFCVQYPWRGSEYQQTRQWLFLPYAEGPPHATKIIFDFFLLLFCARQRRVFYLERTFGEDYRGGSNSEEVAKDWETPNFVNPVPDFLSYIGSWLDVVKRLIFLGLLWVTLAIMFLTGTNRVNLFSMGYLIGSFVFLWQGTDFYLRPKHAILRWWSWLLLYNVCVVCIKTLLQIPGCMFNTELQDNACWLVQLLGIGCVDKFAGGSLHTFIKMKKTADDSPCAVPQEDIGLAWDGVCFAFLLLQRRFFHSYYFYRVIDESKATTILASRGAELIEELRQKQMRQQENQESKILEKIKVKMERIKANQKKIHGPAYPEAAHHDADEHFVRQTYQKLEPSSHQKAVRSGDYYMFDEFDDVDDDVTSLKADDDESSDEDLPREQGIGKLLSNVIKTDLKRAVSMRRASAPAIRSERHLSVASDLTYPRGFHRQSSATHPSMVEVMLPETSLHESSSELGLEPPEGETWIDKLKHYMQIAWAFIESLIVSLTRHLMKYSRDYRYVSKSLYAEKKVLKDKEGFGIGIREGSQMIWEPLPEALVPRSRRSSQQAVYHAFDRDMLVMPQNICRKLSNLSVPEIRILAPSIERGLDLPTPEMRRRNARPARAHDDTDSDSDSDGSVKRSVSQLHDSVYSLPSTESKEATTLEDQDDSMFHKDKSPVVHFVCALWYAVMSHTDIVCYLMVFINQIQSATILSIPLPLMVFLWGTLTIPRPTKTFWVTLIAYTEVIVLIKSMFQFEILPWNQKIVPENMPFTAPRVIGIERKSNYALYDLLLLLIIFLHRFMLKSLGLWKESAPDIELREDCFYRLGPEESRMIAEGQAEEVGKLYADKHAKTGGIKRQPKVQDESVLPEEDEEKSADLEEEMDGSVVVVDEKPGPSREPELLEVPEPPGPAKESDDDHYKFMGTRSGRPASRRGSAQLYANTPEYPVNDDKEPIIAVTTVLEDPQSHFPQVVKLAIKRYLRPVHQFFVRMLDPTARVTADVYAYMFMCDFFNFLVVIFGFAAFGTHQGDGGVQAYLEENKVPIPFLVMLILQFALIIIDRALYLRKFILGKILFQYALIIGVHVWMFFVLPFITERTFNTLLPPPLWYMVKCVYLLLSAYQIRCGYPRRIIGNFLCKGYNYINMFLFRAFMAVPFVFELRTLMDWVWTDTSMTLMDWLKMEDIFANVFLLKCSRYVEDEFPQPRGTKKANISKYLMGGTVLAFIIAIIWFPLVLFAFGNTVGKSNPPTDVTVKIRIGPFLPAYKMTAQSHNIDVFTQQEYDQLSNLYAKDRTAQTFLSNYMYDDVAVITLNADSTNVWAISPPELTRLQQETDSNETIAVKLTFVISHLTNSAENPPTIEEHREVLLPAFVNGTRNPQREVLLRMLRRESKSGNDWMNIKGLFPKFVKVFNKGTAKPAYQLIDSKYDVMDEMMYRDVNMQLEHFGNESTGVVSYWRVHEDCTGDGTLNPLLKMISKNDCNKLVMFTFNDKLFPETLNFISGSGIIGLYTTFVFLASRILRGFFSGIFTKIMFEDLPNVDRVLQMCLDIYLVREALELALEEDLFAKLVFLYRSPETMIKWSRPKDEPEERLEPPPN